MSSTQPGGNQTKIYDPRYKNNHCSKKSCSTVVLHTMRAVACGFPQPTLLPMKLLREILYTRHRSPLQVIVLRTRGGQIFVPTWTDDACPAPTQTSLIWDVTKDSPNGSSAKALLGLQRKRKVLVHSDNVFTMHLEFADSRESRNRSGSKQTGRRGYERHKRTLRTYIPISSLSFTAYADRL